MLSPGFTVGLPTSSYCTAAGCTIPSLAPGASVVLKGTAQVATTTAPGRATVTATATAAVTDPNTADNTGSTVVFVGLVTGALMLGACGGDSAESEEAAPASPEADAGDTAEATDLPKIGLVMKSLSNEFFNKWTLCLQSDRFT